MEVIEYRKISTAFWTDERVRRWSDDARYVFIRILTHKHMTMLGAMDYSVAGIAGDLHWSEQRVRDAIAFAKADGILFANEDANFIALPNFLKYNPPTSINQVKAWGKIWPTLPECPEKTVLAAWILASGFVAEGFKKFIPHTILANALPNALPNASARAFMNLNLKLYLNGGAVCTSRSTDTRDARKNEPTEPTAAPEPQTPKPTEPEDPLDRVEAWMRRKMAGMMGDPVTATRVIGEGFRAVGQDEAAFKEAVEAGFSVWEKDHPKGSLPPMRFFPGYFRKQGEAEAARADVKRSLAEEESAAADRRRARAARERFDQEQNREARETAKKRREKDREIEQQAKALADEAAAIHETDPERSIELLREANRLKAGQ